MIKAVLFDLDGTLLDTNELIYKSFYYTFKEGLNLELSKDQITSMFGQPLQDSFKDYAKEEEIDNLIKMYREYNESLHDNMCDAFLGVNELLNELKRREIKIGIVTSKRDILARRGMEIANIIDYMDVIVTPECTDKHKPNREPAIYACNKLNINPKEAIMVGDSHFDLMCGKDAGCKTCGVKYTALDIKRLEEVNPDYFIDEPMDLLDFIK